MEKILSGMYGKVALGKILCLSQSSGNVQLKGFFILQHTVFEY